MIQGTYPVVSFDPSYNVCIASTFRTRLLVHTLSMVIHFMRSLWLSPSLFLPFITEKWTISWHCLNSPKVTLLSNSNFLNDEQNYWVFFFVRHHVYHQKEFSKYSRAHSTFLVYSRFKRINHKFLQIHMCNIKIQQKAYQFKNLARFNDGQKIITKEGQTAIQTFCQAQPLLTALMHFC